MSLPWTQLLQWRPGRLAANVFHGSLMYGVRLALQALYFLMLARLLGVHQFGVFSGVWVLCGFLAALSGLGYPVLVFRAMAQQPESAAACALRGLATVAWSAVPLTVVLLLITQWQLHGALSLATVLVLGASEILLVPMLGILASLRQGNEQLGRSHAIFATLWACRIAFLLLLRAIDGAPSVPGVVGMHALATLCVTPLWLAVEKASLRAPRVPGPPGERTTGLYFAISGAALITYTELNQSIVLALTGAAAAGLLAVAYKSVALLSAPLSAACQAASPRLVRAAHQGGAATRRVVATLAWPMGAYALASAIGVLVFARLIPLVFGADYARAQALAATLFLLPALSALRLLAAYVLVAMANQRKRTVAELACLGIGLLLNFQLIGRHGLEGAIAAILLTEALTATVLGVLAWRASMASHPPPTGTMA
jgi:O-antigen/teichoic acid export membrane protein